MRCPLPFPSSDYFISSFWGSVTKRFNHTKSFTPIIFTIIVNCNQMSIFNCIGYFITTSFKNKLFCIYKFMKKLYNFFKKVTIYWKPNFNKLTLSSINCTLSWINCLVHFHEKYAIPPPSPQAEPGGARLLWLGAQCCEAVAAELRASARLVPPPSRRLGAFEVGYLPVAPTWDWERIFFGDVYYLSLHPSTTPR